MGDKERALRPRLTVRWDRKTGGGGGVSGGNKEWRGEVLETGRVGILERGSFFKNDGI